MPDPTLENDVENFFRTAFTPGSGGLVEYWRDVTYGSVDISGSQVYGWVELGITRQRGGTGSGVGRRETCEYAVTAAQHAANNPMTRTFFNYIAVVPYNSTVPGMSGPPPDWKNNDPRGAFWIDGSEDLVTGKITLTPPFDGDITAHEMGHTLGMSHDFDADLNPLGPGYADPCCLMSQKPHIRPPEIQA